MRSTLAVKLLRRVMNWDDDTTGSEEASLTRTLSRLAEYKYNTYQQYAPGLQFIESLALWLDQFDPTDRAAALDFVHRRIIFVSDQEMRHLVDLTFRKVVQPILRAQAAQKLSLPLWQTGAIDASEEYQLELRHSLFLGLSDGARIDELRRSARLNNDQVHATHELQTDRAQAMHKEAGAPFRNVFLVDDFYGSGKSVIRWQSGDTWLDDFQAGASAKGKLVRFVEQVLSRPDLKGMFSEDLGVHICVYVAADRALQHIRTASLEYAANVLGNKTVTAQATMELNEQTRLTCGSTEDPFDAILHKYYHQDALMDEHRAVGGEDIVHGFSNCSLPIVFPHNTPNNTVYLIWETRSEYVPLFPRVERHLPGGE